MGFAQLYYTSCETGLSGFAGFQFNAVTPGLAPEMLRTVESLTSYQAPRGLSARPTAAEIAACPVNLVYTCEPGTIVANVIFTGTDFSQRSGNYFAHALVSQDGVSAFGEILPIELWKSPDWASKPVADTELPVLASLPRPSRGGELSREEIGRFLDRDVQAEQLAALLTAAENAVLRSGRPIIIVDPDTAVVARWIAAVCFLLRPAVARRLSFATYHHNPGYVDVHVIGTLPDSDFDLNETAFRSYVVFDVRTARTSDVAPEPGTALLVRAGPGGRRRCGSEPTGSPISPERRSPTGIPRWSWRPFSTDPRLRWPISTSSVTGCRDTRPRFLPANAVRSSAPSWTTQPGVPGIWPPWPDWPASPPIPGWPGASSTWPCKRNCAGPWPGRTSLPVSR